MSALAFDDDAATLLEAAKEASRQAAQALANVNAAIEAFVRGNGEGPSAEDHSEALRLSRVANGCWLLYTQYAAIEAEAMGSNVSRDGLALQATSETARERCDDQDRPSRG